MFINNIGGIFIEISHEKYNKEEELFLRTSLCKKWYDVDIECDRFDNYKAVKINEDKAPHYIKSIVNHFNTILYDFMHPNKIISLINNEYIIINLDLHKIYYYAEIDTVNKYFYIYDLVNDEKEFNKIYMNICL